MDNGLGRASSALGRALAVAALVLGALVVAQGGAAGDARRAGPAWVSGQRVQGSTTSLTLDWSPVRGVSTYGVVYAPGTGYPAKSAGQKSVVVAGTRAVIGGLRPSTTYCFAVLVGRAGGPRTCKVTPALDRAARASAVTTEVATFNVSCGSKRLCNRGWPWRKRQRQVLDRVDRLGADVIAFQEAHLAHTWGKKKRRLLRALPARGYALACATRMPTRKRKGLYGQTVWVRSATFAVVDPRHLSKGQRFTRFGDRGRGFCHALVQHRATGRQVVLASLHLRPEARRVGVRQAETRHVLSTVRGRFGSRPTVLIGDYNSHRGRDRRGMPDTPRTVLEAAGFADASDIGVALGLPYFNSATGFDRSPARSGMWPTHVDRIFVSPGITVPRWGVLALVVRGRYRAPMASDHNPVYATLSIP